jgi:hypothetical protein
MDDQPEDSGTELRRMIVESGLTQKEVLARFNKGQAKPMALRTLKSYLAHPESSSRVPCPEGVVERVRALLSK